MALVQEWQNTPAALVPVFGRRYIWTGTRCLDSRPVFKGDNGTEQCACDDH